MAQKLELISPLKLTRTRAAQNRDTVQLEVKQTNYFISFIACGLRVKLLVYRIYRIQERYTGTIEKFKSGGSANKQMPESFQRWLTATGIVIYDVHKRHR